MHPPLTTEPGPVSRGRATLLRMRSRVRASCRGEFRSSVRASDENAAAAALVGCAVHDTPAE